MTTVATAPVHEPDRYHPPALTGLVDLLSRPVRARPHSRALVVGAERIELSYAGLATLADDLARRLTAAGVRPGDPVGLVAANTVEFVVSLFGAARAGAVVAPLDPALPPGQLGTRLPSSPRHHRLRLGRHGPGPGAERRAQQPAVPGGR
ncbi:AMP-binding protein, partial [Streptomyces sp. NPDC005167]